MNLGPRINWEQRLGFMRQVSYSFYTQQLTNSNGPANFGIGAAQDTSQGQPGFESQLPGLLLESFASSQTDSPSLKVGPYSSFANTGFYQNRLNPSTNLIFAMGSTYHRGRWRI